MMIRNIPSNLIIVTNGANNNNRNLSLEENILFLFVSTLESNCAVITTKIKSITFCIVCSKPIKTNECKGRKKIMHNIPTKVA